MDLFELQSKNTREASQPLAERMRPQSLKSFIGQSHIVGEGAIIRRAIEEDRLFSMILWGPPGCGKTTLSRIIAKETKAYFIHFSAVLSGVKELRDIIEKAKDQQKFYRKRTILFVDEIHRFNKAQQDAFLHHVESGLLTLIGATTENPSFEVISPLLSRCRVFTLNPLTEKDIESIIVRALNDNELGLGVYQITIEPNALNYLIQLSDGDARNALNNLDIVVSMHRHHAAHAMDKHIISLESIEKALQKNALRYDKSGEEHYNLISAFHKSMRGSDPDASLYWLCRMLSAGEDPLYIARRMVRFASEDIGNADPHALTVAIHAMESFRFLGSPEGDLALAQAAIYLSTAPKSNRIYMAYKKTMEIIKRTGSLPVPLHIRNAPTSLMTSLGYGKGYQYAHDAPNAYIPQDYLPDQIVQQKFYTPSERGYEKTIKQRIDYWQKLKNDNQT